MKSNTATKHCLELSGCSPVPLAHYLKALGILRVVAEQADDQAAGCWRRERFVLQSTLDKAGLIHFFLNQYAPTPIVAPWNGGSGFFPKKTAEAALNAIKNSKSDRFEKYRDVINHAQSILTRDDKEKFLSLQKDRKNSKKKAAWEKAKKLLQQRCRNTFPDHALKWIDAAYVLTEDGVQCPPLLGTGGNDGNLEFTNNFMQRLSELFDMNSNSGEPKKEERRAALLQSLFAKNVPGSLTAKAKIGQFFPGSAGGVNTASGFEGKATVNLWDFVLMLEGAMVFASASVKRLGGHSSGKLAYPFCVQQSSAGYASASGSDEADSRPEMWMPLWNQPATLGELSAVFGEGRAQVGRRAARNGVDFARAAVTVGVDRGIAQFQRYGFLKRNGKYYFATPLDRIKVQPNPKANLLSKMDLWLSKLRAKAGPAKQAPVSITRSLLHIESRIFNLCKEGTTQRMQDLLIALGQCERALSYSVKWALEAGIRPLAGTLSLNWLREANTDTSEFRLAHSLASTSIRFDKNKGFAFVQFMEPLDSEAESKTTRSPKLKEPLKPKKGFDWNKKHDPDVQWSRKDLAGNLNKVFSRQLVKISQGDGGEFPTVYAAPAPLVDVVAFIEGRVDDALIEKLVWGLSLINFNYDSRNPSSPSQSEQNTAKATGNELPPAIYSLMKLCFLPANLPGDVALDSKIPVQPQIHRQAALAANAEKASKLAARRLLASGHPTLVQKLNGARETTIRSAAALLFPISNSAIRKIKKHVLQPKEEDK